MEVVATIPILYRGKQYKEGELLPTDDAEMIELWKKAGSVRVIEDGEIPEVALVQPKATPETADAGLEGMAVNGETEENLVGKVPKTSARKTK